MSRAFRTHYVALTAQILLENLKGGKGLLCKPCIDRRIILKWILEKWVVTTWSGFR
jgi:hypothetical protein